MTKAMDKIKQVWNENPLAVIVIGAVAVTAVAKLMDANTARNNSHAWSREVDRRMMMKNR